ncbi:hypothetical protein TELCIR_00198 [Teladorsagia circumcincta]|uniref:Uncharacterized protein n=1 Tax=Teladorsagia circumcincta TaxID=45464 RepID=A0A2G9V5C7_TELCI|nr:hypothetical protein TELCIR_00198 [Teladorsagia circumcincta]
MLVITFKKLPSATRPPVEETSAFLKALLTAHGKDFLVKVFGQKAKGELVGMGGVDKVAVALSQIPTADLFGIEMKLSDEETEHMIAVLEGILNGSTDELTSNEAADFRFFVQKLQKSGLNKKNTGNRILLNRKKPGVQYHNRTDWSDLIREFPISNSSSSSSSSW